MSNKKYDRALWTKDLHDAKIFKTAMEANQATLRLSYSIRARVVIWEDSIFWTVAPVKP